MATTIPQRELRNDVSAVLRRVEAGEEFVVTVSGRPVAELRPLGRAVKGSVAAFVAGLQATPQPTPLQRAGLQQLDTEVQAMRQDRDEREPWQTSG